MKSVTCGALVCLNFGLAASNRDRGAVGAVVRIPHGRGAAGEIGHYLLIRQCALFLRNAVRLDLRLSR